MVRKRVGKTSTTRRPAGVYTHSNDSNLTGYNEWRRLVRFAITHVEAVSNDPNKAKRLLQRLIASLMLDPDNLVPNPYSPRRVVTGFGPTNARECLAKKILLDLNDAYKILQDYLTPGQGLSSSLAAFKRTFAKTFEDKLERPCEKDGTARNSKVVITYAELWHTFNLMAEDPMEEVSEELMEDLGIKPDDPLST